jgi:hypothetical protein
MPVTLQPVLSVTMLPVFITVDNGGVVGAVTKLVDARITAAFRPYGVLQGRRRKLVGWFRRQIGSRNPGRLDHAQRALTITHGAIASIRGPRETVSAVEPEDYEYGSTPLRGDLNGCYRTSRPAVGT